MGLSAVYADSANDPRLAQGRPISGNCYRTLIGLNSRSKGAGSEIVPKVPLGSRAAVVAMLMVRPVCPQLRKCPGSYAWCQRRKSRGRPGSLTSVDRRA